MRKYLKSHRVFGIVFLLWIGIQFLIIGISGKPPDEETKWVPFNTLDLRYYGVGEIFLSCLILYLLYDNYIQRVYVERQEDENAFSPSNVEFLSDLQLSSRINETISGAKKMLILVSPFIDLSPPVRKELSLLKDSNVDLYVIFGKNERNIARSLPSDDLNFFKGFRTVRIVYVDTLHAKFYANEAYMVLSSMNLLEYSQVMNSECGIRIKPTSYVTDPDNKIWNDILKYFSELNESGELIYQAKVGEKVIDNCHKYYDGMIDANHPLEVERKSASNASEAQLKVGKPWSTEEEQELLRLFRGGKSIADIAQDFRRNYNGIRARLVKLGEIEDPK